jgi:hypothetical protein
VKKNTTFVRQNTSTFTKTQPFRVKGRLNNLPHIIINALQANILHLKNAKKRVNLGRFIKMNNNQIEVTA